MRGVLRGLGWLIGVGAVVAAVMAVGRATLGRVAGEPGVPGRGGSFDSWPPVPTAPGRQVATGVANGSRVPAGS